MDSRSAGRKYTGDDSVGSGRGAVFVRENIENKEILGEKETSLQQTLHARAWVLMDADSGRILAEKDADTGLSDGKHDEDSDLHSRTGNREIPMTGSGYQRKRPPCRMSSSICGRGSGTAYRIYSIPDAGIPQRQRRGGGGAHRGKCGRICGENEPESAGDRM